jgi:aminoglycoside phosphotransferase (APT) family kinase protein
VTDVAAVSRRLGAYLGATVAHLRVLASGWETTVFQFILASRSSRLPSAAIGESVVLRFYDGPRADDKCNREAHTMIALASADYPVPQPLLFEPDHDPLGAPFLIMERVAGGPLFASGSFPQALQIFSLGFVGFVRAQAQLHRLDRKGFDPQVITPAYVAENSAPGGALLDRLLEVVAERIERGPLPGLRDALVRLREQADRFRAAPEAIVHMDYHPQNVVVKGWRVTGVIDWVSADCGDRHLCAATTSVILASSAMDHPHWMRDNAAGNTLRALFTALYLPLYQVLAPMEWERFRYCQAVAALLRLSTFGIMRARGPAAAGYRPEAITNITPGVVRLLSRYAGRKAGVPVSIDA